MQLSERSCQINLLNKFFECDNEFEHVSSVLKLLRLDGIFYRYPSKLAGFNRSISEGRVHWLTHSGVHNASRAAEGRSSIKSTAFENATGQRYSRLFVTTSQKIQCTSDKFPDIELNEEPLPLRKKREERRKRKKEINEITNY